MAAAAAEGCEPCQAGSHVGASSDDVERAIAALEETVNACRWQPHYRATASSSRPPESVQQEQRRHLHSQAPSAPSSTASSHELRRPSAASSQEQRRQPACQERASLLTEIRGLRLQLRDADSKLQVVSEEASAASSAARSRKEKHRQWAKATEVEAARLQEENKRLERSMRQAGVEERRLAELVRAAPARAEEILSKLRADCQRLEKENQQLQEDINSARTELSCVRDVVETKRAGPGCGGVSVGTPAGSVKGSVRRGSRSTLRAARAAG